MGDRRTAQLGLRVVRSPVSRAAGRGGSSKLGLFICYKPHVLGTIITTASHHHITTGFHAMILGYGAACARVMRHNLEVILPGSPRGRVRKIYLHAH